MYQKLCSNCPVKTKACMKLTARSIISKQTYVTVPSSASSCIICSSLQMFHYLNTVEPLLRGHPFCTRKVAFQKGWPLGKGRIQYYCIMFRLTLTNGLSSGWPLKRGSTLLSKI